MLASAAAPATPKATLSLFNFGAAVVGFNKFNFGAPPCADSVPVLVVLGEGSGFKVGDLADLPD